MSAPSGVEKARARFGANMGASIRRDRPGASAATPGPAATPASRFQGLARIKGGVVLPVARIVPDPDQPRTEFDPEAIERLASSLKQRGQLQPIRVRWDEAADRWVIVAGERRWRAAQIAGLDSLEAIQVRGDYTDDDRVDDQLAENCVREDLSPFDRAAAFRKYMNRRGWSANQLAKHLNIATSTVTRALEVLSLPDEIKERVSSGEVPPATALALARVEDPEERRGLVEQAAAGRISARQARERTAGRPKLTRASFDTPYGAVSVRIDSPDAPQSRVVEALRAALAMATGEA